jgi:SAM-dependent methyltransferase
MRLDPRASISGRLAELAEAVPANDPDFALVRRIFEPIPDERLAALQRKYEAELGDFESEPAGEYKYLDVVHWTYDKLRLARSLGLDNRTPLSILDLGAGGGHFARACLEFGHHVVSVDIDVPVYDDVAQLLGVRRTIMRVEPGMPLANFDRKFDLVTAIGINFHQIEWNAVHWSLAHWKFLFQDLTVRQLRFPGRIYFELNRECRGEDCWEYNSEVLEYCADRGAKVTDRGAIDWHFSEAIVVN